MVPPLRNHLGRLAAALAGADLHLVHAAALELAARQHRLVRVGPALVGEVVLVGVLPHHLAQVPEGAGHGPTQPASPSPPTWTTRPARRALAPAPTRSAGCSAWGASSVGSGTPGGRPQLGLSSDLGHALLAGPVRVPPRRAASAMTRDQSDQDRSTPSTVELVTIWLSRPSTGGITSPRPGPAVTWPLGEEPIRGRWRRSCTSSPSV